MKKILKITGILLMIFILFIVIEVVISYKCLTVKNYNIESDKIKENVKVVLVSDLHYGTFGENNKRLVSKIKECKPDLILFDGDMINEESKNLQTVITLVKRLKETAPVYYALGNHETGYLDRKTSDLYGELKKAGAVVLEKNYEDIKVKNHTIRIGGLYEYAFAVDGQGKMSKKDMNSGLRDFLMDFEDTKAFKIMMSHRPDSFIFGQAADTWKIDLVVSGHAHGGQVILPGMGGLYGADQGWFPKYVDGIHHFRTVKNMIVTRGLGSDKEKLPRFNNIPEIVVIDLKK